MPIKALKIKVSTPTGPIPSGRGFYQLEEEALYLPLHYPVADERFFSYLESETLSLQVDGQGRLILAEITIPRRRWTVRENLVLPEKAEPVDIRFLDFRESFPAPAILSDRTRQNILIRFSRGPAVHNYFLAQNLIAQADADSRLAAIWVSDIIDDLAGREIAAWRKAVSTGTPPAVPPR